MNSLPPQTIQLKPKEEYSLTLKGRLSAGYQWVSSTDNEKIISIDKKIAPQKDKTSKLPGASSDEVFILTALQKGKATVHFKQLRIWETGTRPVEEKILLIIIE
ncbi:MAG: protease inhibitor I42 family protein [Bacteroidota bacterium]